MNYTPRAKPLADDLALQAWIAARCALGPECWSTAETLHESYSAWCRPCGHLPVTLRTFSHWLTGAGFVHVKTGGQHRRQGIAVASTVHDLTGLHAFRVVIRGHAVSVMLPPGLSNADVLFRLKSLFGPSVSLPAPEACPAARQRA